MLLAVNKCKIQSPYSEYGHISKRPFKPFNILKK